jgi:drug/metabolite transporter (DMT)-like permease
MNQPFPRTSPSTPRLKTFIFLFIIVTFAPLGNVLLGLGMKRTGPVVSWQPAILLHVAAAVLTSIYIWLGIACLFTFFLAYTLLLSWADYSYVQPASSASYAVVAILGHYIIGEAISPLRWLGIVIICLGVLAVGRTPPNTTAPIPPPSRGMLP